MGVLEDADGAASEADAAVGDDAADVDADGLDDILIAKKGMINAVTISAVIMFSVVEVTEPLLSFVYQEAHQPWIAARDACWPFKASKEGRTKRGILPSYGKLVEK